MHNFVVLAEFWVIVITSCIWPDGFLKLTFLLLLLVADEAENKRSDLPNYWHIGGQSEKEEVVYGVSHETLIQVVHERGENNFDAVEYRSESQWDS